MAHPAATLGDRRTGASEERGFVGVVDDQQPRFCSGDQALPDQISGVAVAQFVVGDAAAAAERAYDREEPSFLGGCHPPDLHAVLFGAVGDLEGEIAAAHRQIVIPQAERRCERNRGFRARIALAEIDVLHTGAE